MTDMNSWFCANLPDTCVLDGICGVGGMGVVFRVRQRDWGIPLAVKVPKDAAKQIDNQQFLQEAEIWAELGLHPYVATLYYLKKLDNRYCTFSELVESGGLDSALRSKKLRCTDEETTLSRILSLSASTAWGLDAAHRAGLVHCDFKPGNVLLEPDFTAKVTDFGLARRDQNGPFACPGGTPLYSSPEQAHHARLTAATDYWSWAATVFEMFVGEPSWQSGAAVGAAFSDFVDSGAKFPGFPQIPDKLTRILRSCLAYPPSNRPNSFREIAEEICEMHSLLLDEPCPASPPDMGLVAADSLNNRAVSLLDIGDEPRAGRLLREALALDQFHPEALFNYHVIIQGKDPRSLSVAENQLEASAVLDSFNPTPCLLLARLAKHHGKHEKVAGFLRSAAERGAEGDAVLISDHRLVPVLAKPMAGDELAFHKERFSRLIGKAKNALAANDTENASRYVLMAGDIPGFARHPDLHKLRAVLNQ